MSDWETSRMLLSIAEKQLEIAQIEQRKSELEQIIKRTKNTTEKGNTMSSDTKPKKVLNWWSEQDEPKDRVYSGYTTYGAFNWQTNTMYLVRGAHATYIYEGQQIERYRWFLIVTDFRTKKTRVIDKEPANAESCKRLAEEHCQAEIAKLFRSQEAQEVAL
jgi:hypothetical protein